MTFEEMLTAGKSSNGGWSKPQLKLIGVHWPPKRGWRRKRRGMKYGDAVVKQFIDLKDKHIDRNTDAKGNAYHTADASDGEAEAALDRCRSLLGASVDLDNMPNAVKQDLLIIAEAFALMTSPDSSSA